MTTRILSIAFLLCACGSSSSTADGPITGPVAGKIGGQTFTTQAVRADWSVNGDFLSLRFAPADVPSCPQPQPSPSAGWTEFDVNLVRDNALPGRTGSYSFRAGGPSATQASAAAARYRADEKGGVTQDMTSPSSGTLKVTNVTEDRIEGTLIADDAKNGLGLRGAFSVPICKNP